MSGKRIVRTYNTPLSASTEKVFPLLCPVKEYDWIPTWQCNLIYSKSGYAELGCVFSTDFGDVSGIEIWVVYAYEKNRQIGFVKTGTHITTRYNVSLNRSKSGSTIQWEQELTSIDDQGDLMLDNMTQAVYDQKMKHINELLDFYLIHGKVKQQI